MAMNSFWRALGFRSHDDDIDDLADCPSALPIQSSRQAAEPDDSTSDTVTSADDGTQKEGDSCADNPESSGVCANEPESFPLNIFDSLLEVFNEAQPDFIRKCLDMDAQRRYLYNCVDASFRDYILRIKDSARNEACRERDNEHRRMTEEIDSLRVQVKDSGKTTDDLKAMRASADRQKRTFNERIRDLERQLAAAMAEKEQYDFEVKSLMNKLKVQQVQQSDVQELDELRTRLADANKQITAMNAASAMRETSEAASRREIESLRARVKELTTQLDDAREEEGAAVIKESASESDILLLKRRLAEAEATMKASEQRLVDAESKARNLQARLDEAEKALKETSATDTEEKTVSSDIFCFGMPAVEHHDDESPEKIPAADVVSQPEEQAPKKRRGRPKKTMPRISAIDESMDSTEWLVATPPAGTSVKVAPLSDPAFGYQEPPRKPQPPENDAQMLLF
ncbi:hypothetical protein [Muribaculum intestinale]|jgi:hypothetical protein|uniref:hypothetical protein n=2 Tax=Muribaculum intestinale TaxID=1796646 RepID=UPI0025B63C5B|nr:hypothetical protein [Muribaculum intestinale]